MSKIWLRLRGIDWGSFAVFLLMFGLLFYFIVLPVALVVYNAFIVKEQISIANFVIFFQNLLYQETFVNSLIVAVCSVVTTSLIGIPLAYIFIRYEFFGKRVMQVLTMVPMIMPPFVGALGLTFIFGRHGTLNLLLWRTLKVIEEPINFIYGLHGVIFVETIHLYPLIYLNSMAALANIDPSLEEQAKNLGSAGFRLFRTVTFPLMLPGYAAGAILAFIWAFTDLGTPLMLGHHAFKLLPVQAFFDIQSARENPVMGYVMCVILAAISLAALLAVRKYVGLRQYAIVSSGIPPSALVKRIKGMKRVVVYAFLVALTIVALMPDFGIAIASLGKGWSITPLPPIWTSEFYEEVLLRSPIYIENSMVYSLVAALLDICLGSVIAFLLARKAFPGKSVLDLMAMLPFAVPGIVIGYGYISAFRYPHPLDPFRGALNVWLSMTLMLSLTFRRLPYTVRACYASIQQIHESLEEASMNLGAGRSKTFLNITLPLMIGGLIAGGVLAFSSAVMEVSTSFLLLGGEGQWTLTRAIYEQTRNPRFGLQYGSVMGVVLILVVTACFIFVNKVFGRRMGALFRA